MGTDRFTKADPLLGTRTTGADGRPAFVQDVASAGSGTTADQVQGNVAHDAVDSGNPVKVGGKTSTLTPTAVAGGDRVDAWYSTTGGQAVFLVGGPAGAGTAQQMTTNNVDGKTVSGNADKPTAVSQTEVFNGTTWDRTRNNVDTAALITATAATTSQTGADQTNYNGRGLQVVLDMTTVGTGSVTITIQGKDAASGKYYTLLVGAAVVTNSTNVYTVYPGAPTTANVSAAFPLPRTWRVITTANNANAATYTVGASVIV